MNFLFNTQQFPLFLLFTGASPSNPLSNGPTAAFGFWAALGCPMPFLSHLANLPLDG